MAAWLSGYVAKWFPLPLSIPTPIPAPDHPLGEHERTWGTRVVGGMYVESRVKEFSSGREISVLYTKNPRESAAPRSLVAHQLHGLATVGASFELKNCIYLRMDFERRCNYLACYWDVNMGAVAQKQSLSLLWKALVRHGPGRWPAGHGSHHGSRPWPMAHGPWPMHCCHTEQEFFSNYERSLLRHCPCIPILILVLAQHMF